MKKSPQQVQLDLEIAELQEKLGPLSGKSPAQIRLAKEIAQLEAEIAELQRRISNNGSKI